MTGISALDRRRKPLGRFLVAGALGRFSTSRFKRALIGLIAAIGPSFLLGMSLLPPAQVHDRLVWMSLVFAAITGPWIAMALEIDRLW
jgi:hypothetical protein